MKLIFLSAPRPTLSHFRGDSFNHPMRITAFAKSQTESHGEPRNVPRMFNVFLGRKLFTNLAGQGDLSQVLVTALSFEPVLQNEAATADPSSKRRHSGS